MTDLFAASLNEILVDTFRSILKVEEYALKCMGKSDLTISELHLIESIGKDKENGRTISDIAQDLSITLSSVTIAINKLVKKGYAEKMRCQNDGRVVYVTLTKLGNKMNAVHRYFHEQMIRNISGGFTENEKEVLIIAMDKLNGFFKQKIADMEE